MNGLRQVFEGLPKSNEPSSGQIQFHAVPVGTSRHVLIAKSGKGSPHLLIHTIDSPATPPPPLRLEHLTVQYEIEGRVITNKGSTEGSFSLITLCTSEKLLVEMFLRFVVLMEQQ